MDFALADRVRELQAAARELMDGWAFNCTLRIADGPDEVHKAAIACRELRRYGR